MKRTLNERGSAEMIIIGVLVVALVAALGWIFWQNFKGRDGATKQNTGQSVAEVKEGDSGKDQKPGVDKKPDSLDSSISTNSYSKSVSLSYPGSWNASSNVRDSDYGKTEAISITSPNGQAEVYLSQTSDGQYGGACEPGDGYLVSSVDSQSLYSDNKLVKFYQVVTEVNGVYRLSAGLMNENEHMNRLVAGGSACGMLLQYIISVPGGDARNTVIAGIRMDALSNIGDGTSKAFEDRATIDTVINSEDYKTAVQILRTMTIK